MHELFHDTASALVADPPREAPPVAELHRRVSRRRRRTTLMLTVPAVIALIVGLAVVQAVRPATEPDVPASPPPTDDEQTDSAITIPDDKSPTAPGTTVAGWPEGQVAADIEIIRYSQSFEPECADRFTSGEWDSAVIIAAAETGSDRWRNTFVYPDGSTRSLIAFDSPWYPTSTLENGAARMVTAGCRLDGEETIMVTEPGQGSFYSLDPMDDVPLVDPGNGAAPFPAVAHYSDLGVEQPGEETDSMGRTTTLWTQLVEGFGGRNGSARVTQLERWYVDDSGSVLEYRFEQHIDGIGTATWQATLSEYGNVLLPADAFEDPAVPTGSEDLAPAILESVDGMEDPGEPVHPETPETVQPPSDDMTAPTTTEPEPSAQLVGEVVVANASTTPGLAGSTMRSLQLNGYDVVEAVNAAASVGTLGESIVYARPGHEALRDQLTELLGINNRAVLEPPDPLPIDETNIDDGRVAVLIMLGNDFTTVPDPGTITHADFAPYVAQAREVFGDVRVGDSCEDWPDREPEETAHLVVLPASNSDGSPCRMRGWTYNTGRAPDDMPADAIVVRDDGISPGPIFAANGDLLGHFDPPISSSG